MFGPNVLSDSSNLYYHHREDHFHVLLTELERRFADVFDLHEYNFLFVTGSGSLVNEIIIYSCKYVFKMPFADAEFGSRLQKMSVVHGKSEVNSNETLIAYPLYETSISRLNVNDHPSNFTFLDMVSAFPYYLPSPGTAIWTTVSSKQLGAYPVIGIIAVHKDIDVPKYFNDRWGSYLNLSTYLSFREKCETPATPAIPLLYDLWYRLQNFDRTKFVGLIDARRDYIVGLVGEENIIGEGPVITLKSTPKLDGLAKQFKLYKSKAGYQIFLWSGSNSDWTTLCNTLARYKR